MKNIAFIINPISGTQQNAKRKLPKLIDKELDRSPTYPYDASKSNTNAQPLRTHLLRLRIGER